MCGDKQVRLGEPAYKVLLALIERAGETLNRETLIARAWGTTFIEESNLRTAIASLRRALKDAGSARSYIATVVSEGYRFVEPVVFGNYVATQPSTPMQLS
jgi:DNA-binding winged helix-turn-helix (wHTH) protein